MVYRFYYSLLVRGCARYVYLSIKQITNTFNLKILGFKNFKLENDGQLIFVRSFIYDIYTCTVFMYLPHCIDGERVDESELRRASSRGIIPRAKIKTVKMTFVIVFGKSVLFLHILK